MKKAVVVLALFVLFCICGCNGKEGTFESPTTKPTLEGAETTGATQNAKNIEMVSTASIYTNGQGFAKEGITYVQDSIVQHIDFATGEKFPLCSRLNCSHRMLTAEEIESGTEPCMAYVEGAYQAVVYQEKLYVFAATEENGIRIFVSDMDGANRRILEELAEVTWTTGFSTQFYEDKLLLLADRIEFTFRENGERDMEKITCLYCIDCESGESKKVAKEWNGYATFVGIHEEYACVSIDGTDETLYEEWTSEEIEENPNLFWDYNQDELWLCRYEDGSAEELCPGAFYGWNRLHCADKNGGIVERMYEDGSYELCYMEFATGTKTVLPLPNAMVIAMDGNGILLSQKEKQGDTTVNAMYRFFPEDGRVESLNIDKSIMAIGIMGGNVYCMGTGGRNRVFSLMDLFAGKSEPLYEMENYIYAIMR